MFAIQPGMLKTRMNRDLLAQVREYLAGDRSGVQSPAFRELYGRAMQFLSDESSYTAMELPVKLVLALASGRADALSGRFLNVTDDLGDLIRRAEGIQRDDLYTMRLRK